MGAGLCVDGRLGPPGTSGALEDRGTGGGGRVGTRQGHGCEPEGQPKLKAMARAQWAVMRGEPLRGRLHVWGRIRKRRGSQPQQRTSCAAVVWGLRSLPEVAPSWVLEGLGGAGLKHPPEPFSMH